MHNNMPSLPDLTLNLRVPYNDFAHNAKDNADNGAMDVELQGDKATRATTPRTESAGNLTATSSSYNFTKNIVVKSTPTKTVAPDESNKGDLLVRSPFINVLRKPTSTTSLEEKPLVVTVSAANSNRKSVEQINAPKASPISLVTVVPPAAEVLKAEQQLRPKVLHLRDSNASLDTSTSTDDPKLTPTTAAVPLREKSKLKSNVAVANVRNSMDVLAANAKDVERKSAPAPVVQSAKAQSVKTTRRSTSLLDSSPAHSQSGNEERGGAVKLHESTSGSSTPNDDGVPEFMRIQLNRVDPARIAKSANVVLAKNVRELQTPTQQQQQQQKQNVELQKSKSDTNTVTTSVGRQQPSSQHRTSISEMDKAKLAAGASEKQNAVVSGGSTLLLDGAPVNTIIFENTNYKQQAQAAQLKRSSESLSSAVSSGVSVSAVETLSTALSQMSFAKGNDTTVPGGGVVVSAAGDYDKDMKLGFTFGDATETYVSAVPNKSPNDNESKVVSVVAQQVAVTAVGQQQHQQVQQQQQQAQNIISTADLNMKIASVKKVWESVAPMTSEASSSALQHQQVAHQQQQQAQQQVQQQLQHQQQQQQQMMFNQQQNFQQRF
uniref:DUF4739 domain-containing protein n=2 Tax=Bactrocera dorsalis TaxID=27457 RepID=A0A034V1M2_BACDO